MGDRVRPKTGVARLPRGEPSESRRRADRGLVWSVAVVVIVYLALVVTFSLRTPAWENDDEVGHTLYTEYLVEHHTLPPIAVASGDESHQAPLYYMLLAGYQTAVGIPAFHAELPPATSAGPGVVKRFEVRHDYTPGQHQQAVWLHALRVFSIGCGLVTVLAAYLTGWLLTGKTPAATAVSVTVAAWPKFIVISAAVTNSALVDAFCACALPCWLWWYRSRSPKAASVTGGVLGAAVLTQVTALPLAALLVAAMGAVAFRRRDWRSPLLTAACTAAISGWWFLRNTAVYGDPLATAATDRYLRAMFRLALIRPHPTLSLTIIRQMLPIAAHSTWYSAGWDQLLLPRPVDDVLSVLAGISVLAALRAQTAAHVVVGVGAVASVFAWLLIVRSTTHAQGRYLLTGITAWATLLVMGATRIASRRRWQLWAWPTIFLAVDGYLILTAVIPYGGL